MACKLVKRGAEETTTAALYLSRPPLLGTENRTRTKHASALAAHTHTLKNGHNEERHRRRAAHSSPPRLACMTNGSPDRGACMYFRGVSNLYLI